MSDVKPVILFNFGYNRKGWISPIEALKDDIEIVYLYYVAREQETVRHTRERVVYWGDYKNVHELLDAVRPRKIVSMSIDSGVGILLNYAAKKRKIPTFILQHGIYSHYNDYRERERRTKRLGLADGNGEPLMVKGFSTLSFFKASLKPADYFSFLKFPLYFWLQKKEGPRYACRWVRFDARMPDRYICYTWQNAIIHRELDKPRESKFLYIGNPEMDEFFASRHDASGDSYYLLVDQPLADNRYGEHICTRTQMAEHYRRLNKFCLANKARLKVKLHPESYHSDWLPEDGNIDWIKDHQDLPGLVKGAKGCFGYFSTLLIPAIYFNWCVLFRVSANEMQQDAAGWGLIQLLDFFNYSLRDIRFDNVRKDDLNIFVEKYLLYDDGRSVQRLKDVLLN